MIPGLVVVPQAFEHDDAVLVGSRTALACLRRALDAALQRAAAVESGPFDPGDGEGFRVLVVPTDEPLQPWYAAEEPGQAEWGEFVERVIRPHFPRIGGDG